MATKASAIDRDDLAHFLWDFFGPHNPKTMEQVATRATTFRATDEQIEKYRMTAEVIADSIERRTALRELTHLGEELDNE